MAVLSDADRAAVMAVLCSDNSRVQAAMPLTKTDLRAAINAIDVWVDTNATAFNSAIPQPARSALTAKQKAELLMRVVRRRFEVA